MQLHRCEFIDHTYSDMLWTLNGHSLAFNSNTTRFEYINR